MDKVPTTTDSSSTGSSSVPQHAPYHAPNVVSSNGSSACSVMYTSAPGATIRPNGPSRTTGPAAGASSIPGPMRTTTTTATTRTTTTTTTGAAGDVATSGMVSGGLRGGPQAAMKNSDQQYQYRLPSGSFVIAPSQSSSSSSSSQYLASSSESHGTLPTQGTATSSSSANSNSRESPFGTVGHPEQGCTAKHGPGWTVPNPLLASQTQPSHLRGAPSPAVLPLRQSSHQQQPQKIQQLEMDISTTRRMAVPASAASASLPPPPHHHHVPSRSTMQTSTQPASSAQGALSQQPLVSRNQPPPMLQQQQQQQQQQSNNTPKKPKVVLSAEAKQALAKAIWSAIRSTDGTIAQDLMNAALATGLPKHAVLNAARVAREREAMKRQSMQQQQQQQKQPQQQQIQQKQQQQKQQIQQQQQKQQQQKQQIQQQQQQKQQQFQQQVQNQKLQQQQMRQIQRPRQQQPQQPQPQHHKLSVTQKSQVPFAQNQLPGKPIPNQVGSVPVAATRIVPSRPPSSATLPKPLPNAKSKPKAATSSVTPPNLSGMVHEKLEERTKWKRVLSGGFVKQKGRFMALSHSVCAIVRTANVKPALRLAKQPTNNGRRRPRSETLAHAARIQRLLSSSLAHSPPDQLLDPEKFKRVKIEPKKYGKALDRAVRKGRQAAAEQLSKQHKELSKAITSHQQEFFKFHRQRKTEAYRLAKVIRDSFEKEEKKKEKDVAAAERARLAALKANDMDAYSKLLEETKNDRLKFLMDKTEKHFSQISTSLLQTRNKDGSVSSAGGTGSYYASAHLKTEEVRQPSILVGGDLKEYQLSGLQWLVSLYNNKLNGILADEMGLGKTIQAIALVSYLMEFKNNLGPYLVIVPLSTLSNWTNEFIKWCPSAHTVCYKGTPSQRKDLYREQVRTGHFNVLLTTYEYIIKDKASLRKITWQYAIVDEGHRMKNSASKFAKTLSSQYTTQYRLLLTGTPLMNDLSELWSLLNFLLPAIFNSVETFDQWFNRPFAQFGNSSSGNAEDEANVLSNEERMFIIHRLHELLRPFMLRRVKSEVLDQLPEKVEKILRCELSSWQKELYKQISAKAVAENSLLGSGYSQPQGASRGLNNIVMQLRKVCNHPYLFSPEGYHINENIIRSSGKVELLDRMLPKLKAAGHRVLMFTQMTAVMTILEDYFSYRGYLSLRLDGSTPAEEREKRMYKFNAPDSPYFIFLLSTRAGGLGLNLTSADTVIIFDSDWNPMMDLQAQDRAHRIGQRSDVSVFRLVTYTPVEEKILSRATEKLNMSELVVEAGKFDKRSVENDNSLERKRMMEVLLTDFDTTANAASNFSTGNYQEKTTSEFTGSASGDEDNDEDVDGSDSGDKDELNDMLSNNESDYQLYEVIDAQRARDSSLVDASLFSQPSDVPDWIKYPNGKRDGGPRDVGIVGDGARKRKEVMYDDGLTEKQFLRLVEKQADGEDAAKADAKAARRALAETSAAKNDVRESAMSSTVGTELTDWTFRKLISCTKAVIALKDPSTKRRLCEVFLEKPAPEQYPDYYELIEKPIAINDILRKCRAKLYTNFHEFLDDWKLMFSNAKTFNGDGSWVVEDGKVLYKELDRVLKKNGFSEESQKPRTITPKKRLRIKLSLKTLKSKKEEVPAPPSSGGEEEESEDEDVHNEPVPSRGRRSRKRRKIR